jgi:hypothetical protein
MLAIWYQGFQLSKLKKAFLDTKSNFYPKKLKRLQIYPVKSILKPLHVPSISLEIRNSQRPSFRPGAYDSFVFPILRGSA